MTWIIPAVLVDETPKEESTFVINPLSFLKPIPKRKFPLRIRSSRNRPGRLIYYMNLFAWLGKEVRNVIVYL